MVPPGRRGLAGLDPGAAERVGERHRGGVRRGPRPSGSFRNADTRYSSVGNCHPSGHDRRASRPLRSPSTCCCPTSTTPSGCTSPATPPARTSTPACGSGAATRPARWPPSTSAASPPYATAWRRGTPRPATTCTSPPTCSSGSPPRAGPRRPGRRRRRRRLRELRHEIATVGVVGTGTMASGIAQVFAQAGYDVVYVGRGEEKVAGVRAGIEKALDKAIAKGKLDEAGKAEVLGRLTGATTREALADVDIVVEAIAEDLAVKTELFADLDRICKRGRDPGHHHLLAADQRVRGGDLAARVGHRHALLQPRAGHEAGRGGHHRADRCRGRRDHPRAVREGRQGRGLLR